MSQTYPDQAEVFSHTFIICGVLSLGLHAGLLAGFNMIQKSEPLIETVPLVNVTLLPTEIPAEPKASKEPSDSVPPPMLTTPRSTQTQTMPPPTAPAVTQPRPITANSTLNISPVQSSMSSPTPPLKKRLLKDRQAADALFAQQTTKLAQRSTTAALPLPSTPTLSGRPIKSIPLNRSLNPSVTSIHATPATTQRRRKRRLITQLPPTSGAGIAKIGVRHSVQPVYPRVAKEEGWEGIVLLKVLVRTSGLPGEITVRKSSGHVILDKAAIKAMRQWRFVPAMDGNFPVEKYLQVPLKFGLHR